MSGFLSLTDASLFPSAGRAVPLEVTDGSRGFIILGFNADCFSLLYVTALLLRDLVLFRDDDRGGGVGSGVFVFLSFRPARSVSVGNVAMVDDADVRFSFTAGSFGVRILTFEGIGTV